MKYPMCIRKEIHNPIAAGNFPNRTWQESKKRNVNVCIREHDLYKQSSRGRQTNRKVDSQTVRKIYKQTFRQIDRQVDITTDRKEDR